jgi:polyisoprenoid-binding protein YceI
MKKFLSIALLTAFSTTSFAQSTWNVDNAHSSVKFSVSHLVISEVEGAFKKFTGSYVTAKPDLSDAKINFNVDINSIDTDNANRDKHLKSDDFFNAAEYPQMTFTSTSITKLSDNKYALYGNLTIRNTTKPIKFDVVYGGTAKDGYGNTKAGFKATTIINRFDYNLKWNNLTEAGGATVGKDVTLDLKLEFGQAKA